LVQVLGGELQLSAVFPDGVREITQSSGQSANPAGTFGAVGKVQGWPDRNLLPHLVPEPCRHLGKRFPRRHGMAGFEPDDVNGRPGKGMHGIDGCGLVVI
jgi:hypothetical protein